MELPWQTNWTEKMKTNATANRILNTPIGDSTFFSPPDFDGVKRYKVKVGQFDGQFDDQSSDEKASEELKPKFTNITYDTMTETQYNARKSQYDALLKPEHITKKTPGKQVILLDLEEIEATKAEESDSYSIMNNTYVKDYIHINHPSIRQDWTSALTNKPLLIKPPPFFFSQ